MFFDNLSLSNTWIPACAGMTPLRQGFPLRSLSYEGQDAGQAKGKSGNDNHSGNGKKGEVGMMIGPG